MNRLHRSSVNMISSLLGYTIPMIITFVTTPLLLHKLGTAAYGLQSLVAVVIGYLTFVDMGLDIPIVKLLAQDRAIKDTEAENHLLSTMSQLYFGIGILGLLIIIILSDWLARSVFQMPVAMQSQADRKSTRLNSSH